MDAMRIRLSRMMTLMLSGFASMLRHTNSSLYRWPRHYDSDYNNSRSILPWLSAWQVMRHCRHSPHTLPVYLTIKVTSTYLLSARSSFIERILIIGGPWSARVMTSWAMLSMVALPSFILMTRLARHHRWFSASSAVRASVSATTMLQRRILKAAASHFEILSIILSPMPTWIAADMAMLFRYFSGGNAGRPLNAAFREATFFALPRYYDAAQIKICFFRA